MMLIIAYNRVWNKIKSIYRQTVFKKLINCSHSKFSLVGNVTLINTNIKLGENVTIYPDVMFYGDGLIEIGNNVAIGNGTIIYSSAKGGVCIGDNTLIAAQAYIIDCDHGTEKNMLIRQQKNSVEKVVIGQDVWLGANVTVLKGSVIQDGAVIGAKSLVKGNIAPNVIAVGIPAKEIKKRV